MADEDVLNVVEAVEATPTEFAALLEAEKAYNAAQLADDFSRIIIVDGEFQKIPGQMKKIREDQVENNAGGFVFEASDETKIRRFLILGTSSPTYYFTPKEITLANTEMIIKLIEEGKAMKVLTEIEAINRQNRNPKMSPLLFVLAICARYNVSDNSAKITCPHIKAYSNYIHQMHQAAFSLVPAVCRIPTHLFEFVKYCEIVAKGSKTTTGWGRLMRRTINKWYTTKTAEKLAMFLTKYPQREGWSHRDLFRLAHPLVGDIENIETRADRLEMEQIFRYAVKGSLLQRKRTSPNGEEEEAPPAKEEKGAGDEKKKEKKPKTKVPYTEEQLDKELNSSSLNMIETYLKLKQEKNEEIIIEAIKKHGLVREHLPTDCLNSQSVWETLFDIGMPMTAMIRNLAKMTVVNALNNERVAKICARLTDEQELKKSRIHPIALLNAKAIYEAGRGDKGSLKWEPIREIGEALEKGFYKSFANAPKTEKRFLLALDVSGSMCSPVSGSVLTCREAATAMSLINIHNEPLVKCVAFCDELVELPFTKEWSMEKINNHVNRMRFGRTDCGLPMLWAAEKNLEFDVFIVYTDNDTWAGEVHPFEAMQQYRKKMNLPDARLVVMGMQAYPFTIADPRDRGMLDICGFDSAVPQILHEFISGNI